jgi:glycine cleavage system H protein
VDLHVLKYSPEHLWVKLDDDNTATIGLTEEALKDYEFITKVRLPSEGEELAKDEVFGRIHVENGPLFKLQAPLTGEVLSVNEDMLDTTEAILEDPYEEGWLIRMTVLFMPEYDDLMTKDEYDEFILDELSEENDDDDDDDD